MYQQQQQRYQNQQQRQQHIPGQFFTTGTQYIFTSGPSGTTQTVTPLGSSGPTPAHGSQQSTGGHTLGGNPSGAAPTTEEGAAGEGQHLPLGPQWHSPPSLISRYVNMSILFSCNVSQNDSRSTNPIFFFFFLPLVSRFHHCLVF